MTTDQVSSGLPKIDLPEMPISGDTLARRFDEVYQNARGEAGRVPWADGRPCPQVVAWLNTEARVLVRPGCRAVVVGCGLGDDVVELADRGYDVQGFDVSATAVQWAARRHPAHAERFQVADLLAPPSRLLGRFDLVVEVCTIQSLEPAMRPSVASALVRLLCPRGVLVVVARGREPSQPLSACVGQPWPLTIQEILDLMAAQGLSPVHGPCGIEECWDTESPPNRRLCGAFMRM
ncbi:MAG: class I SAM-dependent methyltransferase [Phycisphaerales bacterium]